MSASLRPQDLVLSIAPQLLHSKGTSSSFDPNNLIDPYRSNVPASPHSLGYPPSPAPDPNNLQHRDQPHPPTPKPISSPTGMLVVHSYDPASAAPGTGLTAQVDFTNYSGTNVRLRIVFGDLALPTSVSPNVLSQDRGPGHERGDWNLRITVPPVGHASERIAGMGTDGRPEWPLTLQALDSGGNLLDTIIFGIFSYESVSLSQKLSSPSTPSTIYGYRSRSPSKRSRQPEDDDECSPSPTKRPSVDTNMPHIPVINNSFMNLPPRFPIAHRTAIEYPPASLGSGISISPQTLKHHLQSPNDQQSPNNQEPQVETHQCDPHSQALSLPEVPAVPSSPGVHADDGPTLIRTTQLGRSVKAQQASVSVQGDLEHMKRGWSEEEYRTGRRLVQFWKRQVGTMLHISFAAVAQNDYKENTIVVSCIYRSNDYFITSVDAIYLLEAFTGSQFEVEEKNRIRRNLEGCRPMTISKSKPGTEGFFRMLMELPPPRPRNIEKDVKVFEWGKLKSMFKRVFSKYSVVPGPKKKPPPPPPAYDVPAGGISDPPYRFPPPTLPDLSVPPVGVRHETQKRHNSFHGSRLRDLPPLPPLHTSLQNQSSSPMYPNDFPVRYNDYNGSSFPGEFDSSIFNFTGGLFKQDIGFAHGPVGAPATVGRHHQDGFRSGSPASCDNSPQSMTRSVSSGTSSEGGQVDSQDLATTAVPPGAAEPVHIMHRHL